MASIYSPLYEQLGAPVVAYYQQRSAAAAREHREKLPLVHISASSNWVGSRGHAFGKGIRKEITSSIDAKYIPNIQEEAWNEGIGASKDIIYNEEVGHRNCGNCLHLVTCNDDFRVLVWATHDSRNAKPSNYRSILKCSKLLCPIDTSIIENNPQAIEGEHVSLDLEYRIDEIVCCPCDYVGDEQYEGIAILTRSETHGIRLFYCSLTPMSITSKRARSKHSENNCFNISLEELSLPPFVQPTQAMASTVYHTHNWTTPVFSILYNEVGKERKQMIRQIFFDECLDSDYGYYSQTNGRQFTRHASWGKFHIRNIEHSSHPSGILASTTIRGTDENFLSFIDTRSPAGVEQRWNPSNEEYIHKGIVADQILHHPSKVHAVYVSTYCNVNATERLYELDYRMPGKKVLSWSLPYAGNSMTGHSIGTSSNPIDDQVSFLTFADTGILPSSEKSIPDTVLSIKKSPGVIGLCMYQPPLNGPLFETKVLEVGCSIRHKKSSIAQSSFWYTSKTDYLSDYICGLASVRVKNSRLFDGEDIHSSLGYTNSLSYTLCVLILSSCGDIYCHSFLECSPYEDRKSILYEGLPVGCRCLRVPSKFLEDSNALKQDVGEKNPTIYLCNEFQIPKSSGIESSLSLELLKPFDQVQLSEILQENSDDESKITPQVDTSNNKGMIPIPVTMHELSELNSSNEPSNGRDTFIHIGRTQNSVESIFTSSSAYPCVLDRNESDGIKLPSIFTSIMVPGPEIVSNKDEDGGSDEIEEMAMISSLEKSFSSTLNDDKADDNEINDCSQSQNHLSQKSIQSSQRSINFVRVTSKKANSSS